MEWRNVVCAIGIISLCFFAVPIRVNRDVEKQDQRLFEVFVARYNKSYKHDPAEYERKFKCFQRSLRQIEKFNSLRLSNLSAYYGVTKYSDLSESEFLETALRQPDFPSKNIRYLTSNYLRKNVIGRTRRANEIPSTFDWRDKGVVTRVKSQGTCGACWAFSTVEVAESMFAIKNGTLEEFSVQQMIDCASYNYGCEGGDICSLLLWLTSSNSKILPASEYPFVKKTESCKLQKFANNKAGIAVTDYTCDSFVGTEDEMLQTIVNHGPVAAAVNALSWQNYLGGVIQYHCDGSFNNLNHAVQIVGYDNTANPPFYIVRNSWGSVFGDEGYLYISIGENMCGIANHVSSLQIK